MRPLLYNPLDFVFSNRFNFYFWVFHFADIFPSDFVEWEPVESFTGTFQAIHVELGELLYAGSLSSELVSRDIFFYSHTYVTPRQDGYGSLSPIQLPSFDSLEWPRPDNALIAATKRRMEVDVHAAMKCTYGSHKATVTWFMPLHVFVHIFRLQSIHRTPTMWICRGDNALNSFLAAGWETKIVNHQGDNIKCSVIGELLVFRYHIARQSLSMVFSYRRWKQTRGVWEALDSDVSVRESIELQILLQDDVVHDIFVNNDWHLGHLREYLNLRYTLPKAYLFVVNGKIVRSRKEKGFLCETIAFPRCVAIKACN